MKLDENSLRYKIFIALINSKKELSLSDIAKKIHLPPQHVSYHLPFLEESGLIIKTDDGTYFPQPILVDKEIRDYCLEKMGDIINKILMEKEVYFEYDTDEENTRVLYNCLNALVSMSLNEISSE